MNDILITMERQIYEDAEARKWKVRSHGFTDASAGSSPEISNSKRRIAAIGGVVSALIAVSIAFAERF